MRVEILILCRNERLNQMPRHCFNRNKYTALARILSDQTAIARMYAVTVGGS